MLKGLVYLLGILKYMLNFDLLLLPMFAVLPWILGKKETVVCDLRMLN